jgi:hypothetical protein
MSVNCMLYRVNRLAPLRMLLERRAGEVLVVVGVSGSN